MAQNVYTSVANSMVAKSQILSARLATSPLGEGNRALQIAELGGPSTAGGVLSRQSMMLSASGEQPVCGWVDFAATSAEVRDFQSMKKSYEQRFRKPFDVQELEYREWLQKLLAAFKELGVRCDVTGDEAAASVTEPALSRPAHEENDSAQGSSLAPIFIVGGLAIAVLLITFLALVMRR